MIIVMIMDYDNIRISSPLSPVSLVSSSSKFLRTRREKVRKKEREYSIK